jgi:hypothetical protein
LRTYQNETGKERMVEQWQFIQQPDGGWVWRHLNASNACRQSSKAFQCQSDCVANAIYHGYVPPPERAISRSHAPHREANAGRIESRASRSSA